LPPGQPEAEPGDGLQDAAVGPSRIAADAASGMTRGFDWKGSRPWPEGPPCHPGRSEAESRDGWGADLAARTAGG